MSEKISLDSSGLIYKSWIFNLYGRKEITYEKRAIIT